MENKDVLLRLLIKEVSKEMTRTNFYGLFLYNKMIEFQEMVNGQTIVSLGLLDKEINILGVNIRTEWELIKETLMVNSIFNHKDHTEDFLMSSTIASQPIQDDYVELIFLYAVKLYGFLVDQDIESASVLFDIKDYYDILYCEW